MVKKVSVAYLEERNDFRELLKAYVAKYHPGVTFKIEFEDDYTLNALAGDIYGAYVRLLFDGGKGSLLVMEKTDKTLQVDDLRRELFP